MNVYFQTKCARETRNEYCESSRVSLTRQLRDWVPQDTNMGMHYMVAHHIVVQHKLNEHCAQRFVSNKHFSKLLLFCAY